MSSSQVPVRHWSLLALQSRAAPLQVPAWHASFTVQKRPSVQLVPLVSGAVQLLAASLQESLQFGPTSCPGHGLPVPTQVPVPLQVSVAVQKRPSVQLVPLVSGAVQLLAASFHESLQFGPTSCPGHG